MYVTDKLYLGLYSEKGDKGKKLKTLVSGSKLFVDAIEGGYAEVETDQGVNGWVKKRFLVEKAPAIVQLKLLQAEQSVGEVIEKQALQVENKTLKEKIALLEKRYAESQQKERSIQSELEQLKQNGAKDVVLESHTSVVKTELEDKDSVCTKSVADDSETNVSQELLALKQKVSQAVSILSLSPDEKMESSENPLLTSLKNNQMVLIGVLLLIILLSFFVGAKWVSWRIRNKLGGDLVW
ncbi:MAG: TIGR04211 family SH3 domain-containing protein [Gammaproteobacteria bacterium]|nr:TIGR04211 family SH3 domain-containing protein [Gammaproteobacteria bacterium]